MRAKENILKKQDLNAVVVLEDIFSDFRNCHEKCRLCFKEVTEQDSRIQITDDIEKKINSVLQVHLSLDGMGSEFICSKCENNLNISHQFTFKINEKLKCYGKFSSKKVDDADDGLPVPFQENFIKVEDELKLSTEMELTSPINEVKEESSGNGSATEPDESQNKEANEPEKQDLSNPQFILSDSDGKILKNGYTTKPRRIRYFNTKFQCDICGKVMKTKANIARHMNTHKDLRTRYYHCQICESSFFDKHGLKTHVIGVHEKPKHLNCSLCRRTFRTERGLKSHKLRPCRLPCEICGKSIGKNGLKEHLNVMHFKIKPYECDICGKKFRSKTEITHHLNTHISLEHRTRDYQCDHCEASFFDKCGLQRHTLNMHEKPEHLTCSLCSRTFKTEEGLKNHKLRPHRLPCEVCGKSIGKNELRRHLNTVHFNIKPYQCNICGKKFGKKSHLTRHVNTHKDFRTKDFHCQICESSYFNKETLQTHILNNHERPKHLTCTLCRITFKTERGLKSHKLLPHRLPCEICGKSMGKNALKMHLNVMHFKMKPYQCDICDNKFRNKNEVTNHLNTHISLEHRTRDYQCDLCEASFFDKCSLRTHTFNMHEKQKHLICSLCSKAFRTEEGLKNHKLRPHKVNEPCEICGKSIRNLKHHLNKMHFNIKRCQCDICGKKFRKSNLARHISTHIGLGPRTKDFHCQICGKSFFSKPGLKAHTRTVHEKNSLQIHQNMH
ncbi:CLUMA_CG009350, isoform A [Clunio marinus]|uniref:CLUMA_CG009350, isoform A n=1 Tax=Clunio marinus TaxID=568069 RepID=A0A1J1I6L7_9DIPT|nr:CLUMA_CG009350, isoform A [Clunio marinus]